MKKIWELFYTFFKIGIFTIGGGMAMLPLVHNAIVNRKRWMTEEEMIDCLAVTQSIPGAVVVNAATYIGKKIKGFPGSVAATLGVVLPSFICIILIVTLLGLVGENEYLNGFFKGALAAAAGLVCVALVRMGKTVYKGPFDIVIGLIVFVLVIFFKVSVVWVILGSIVVGFLLYKIKYCRQRKKQGGHEDE